MRRVLIIRTSRFVQKAIEHARNRWPEAEIRVLCQAGSEAEVAAIGVPPDAMLLMPSGHPITAAGVLSSRWGWQALRWRPDVILVQWWNSHGQGHERASRAALLIRPRGLHAICEDGTCTVVTARERTVRWLRGVTVVLTVGLATMILWPASNWFAARERRRRVV